MIEKNHPTLPVGAQYRLLSLSRSSFYYALMGETAMNLDLMVMIDKQFLETSLLRRAADDMAHAERGPCCELQAHPAPDAAYAPDADLPEARHQQAGQGPQDLPLSAGWTSGGAAQPGLARNSSACRPAKIVVDHLNIDEPVLACDIDKVVLPPLAFQIDHDLRLRRLTRRRMRWSPTGAHRVAVTRAAVLDGRLTVTISKRAA
jgi:hypothetical protein